MPDSLNRLMDGVRLKKQLTITLRIHDGAIPTPLGVDRRWFGKLLFVAGTSEFVFEYATHLVAPRQPALYDPGVLQQFDRFMSNRARSRRSWVDVYQDEGALWVGEFQSLLRQRRSGGFLSVGSGDPLRIQLQSAWKENPSVRQFLAAGAVGAMLTLAGSFGGVHLMQERGAAACRQQYFDYSRKQTDAILKSARFEGKLSAQHNAALANVQEAVNAGIAACGSSLKGSSITIGGSSGVALDVGDEQKKKKK
jgi:hypothetical protein